MYHQLEKSTMSTSSPDFIFRGYEDKPLCKVISNSQHASVPFDLYESANQSHPDLVSDFDGGVHSLEFGVSFLGMDGLCALALGTGSDVVGDIRTHPRQVVPFWQFSPLLCCDLGLHPWIDILGCLLPCMNTSF